MSKIKIRKRVDLDFLGEEYKEAYLVFQSLPISRLEKYRDKISSAGDDKAISTMLELVKENFLEGKFPDEKGTLQDLEAADLDGLDQESMLKCFEAWSGLSLSDDSKAGLDPKDSNK